MKPTAFVTLFFLICSLDFRAVSGGKKTTTRSSNVCSKGITVTFPSYISKTNGVSNTDPLFSKKCKNVLNTFGLWLLCNSGPKYQCSIPSTPPTSITTTTTAATATSTTTTAATATSTTSTTQSGPKYQCKTSTAPTVCNYNGTTYPVGSQIENTANSPLCYLSNCQSNGSWVPPASTTGACVPPFQNYPPYGCLMIVSNASLDFCTARLECQKAGGDLWTSAYLDSMNNYLNISQALESYFPSSTHSTWIGAYGNGTNLYWLNGTVATNKVISTSVTSMPDYTGYCLIGHYTSYIANSIKNYAYGWGLTSCAQEKKNFICERLP